MAHLERHGFTERRTIPSPRHLAGLQRVSEIDTTSDLRLFLIRRMIGAVGWEMQFPIPELLRPQEVHKFVRFAEDCGAKPYLAIGDSHSKMLIADFAPRKRDWLTGIHFLCTGASALGLGNPASRSGYGPKLLAWFAECPPLDIPVIMQFGQVDAEFVWHFQRVRDDRRAFTMAEFEDFARRSVQSYAAFLEQLRASCDTIHVCSLNPPTLGDHMWEQGYLNAHIATLEGDRTLAAMAEGIRRLEIPSLRTRTQMHAFYNDLLQAECERLGLGFVDLFTPFLGSHGLVGKEFASVNFADHHLRHRATTPVVAAALWRMVGTTSRGPIPCPTRSASKSDR